MKYFQNLFDRDEGKDAWMCTWEGVTLIRKKNWWIERKFSKERDQDRCVQS